MTTGITVLQVTNDLQKIAPILMSDLEPSLTTGITKTVVESGKKIIQSADLCSFRTLDRGSTMEISSLVHRKRNGQEWFLAKFSIDIEAQADWQVVLHLPRQKRSLSGWKTTFAVLSLSGVALIEQCNSFPSREFPPSLGILGRVAQLYAYSSSLSNT